MIQQYFKRLYNRTMAEAYQFAEAEVAKSISNGGTCLDCGAHDGERFFNLEKHGATKSQYTGIEWHDDSASIARSRGLNVVAGDLNRRFPFPDESFDCVYGLSVLEHLLRPCHFMREATRCLRPGGTLVLLTPNISTFFTIALLLAGKMPSSGPHPDSDALLKGEELFKVSADSLHTDAEAEAPVHRHLVVFSYKVLRRYLQLLELVDIRGRGYGLYPFPNFTQPLLERLDPFHCHQMVFVARKRAAIAA
jgi:SAM-dependent methyltransferase